MRLFNLACVFLVLTVSIDFSSAEVNTATSEVANGPKFVRNLRANAILNRKLADEEDEMKGKDGADLPQPAVVESIVNKTLDIVRMKDKDDKEEEEESESNFLGFNLNETSELIIFILAGLGGFYVLFYAFPEKCLSKDNGYRKTMSNFRRNTTRFFTRS